MIYSELTQNNFAHELSSNKDNWFSFDGACILFDYLDTISEDTENNIEFDEVALRCEFSEFESPAEYIQDYWLESELKEYIEDNELEDQDKEENEIEFFNDVIIEKDNFIWWDENTFIIRVD